MTGASVSGKCDQPDCVPCIYVKKFLKRQFSFLNIFNEYMYEGRNILVFDWMLDIIFELMLYDRMYNYTKLYYWKIYIEFCISLVYKGDELRNTI